MKKLKCVLLVFAFSLFAAPARAEFKWSELRIYGTSNQISNPPAAINAIVASDQVSQLNVYNGLGIEADARLSHMLKIGTRVRGVWAETTAANAPNPPAAFIALQEFQGSAFVRVPLVDANLISVDAFGEAGIENAHIDVATSASGAGTFTKNSGFFQRAGGSVGIGGKSFKFFFEAGQEWNYMDSVQFAGTLTNGNSVKNIDLSGPYFAAGIIISGIPGWIHPGSVSTSD